MTMTSDEKVLATARRRRAVRLTMVAGAMLTLAASWFGVVRADQVAEVANVPQPAAVASVSRGADVASPDTTSLVPAPPATRQVVVVRRTRPS